MRRQWLTGLGCALPLLLGRAATQGDSRPVMEIGRDYVVLQSCAVCNAVPEVGGWALDASPPAGFSLLCGGNLNEWFSERTPSLASAGTPTLQWGVSAAGTPTLRDVAWTILSKRFRRRGRRRYGGVCRQQGRQGDDATNGVAPARFVGGDADATVGSVGSRDAETTTPRMAARHAMRRVYPPICLLNSLLVR